MFHTVLSWKRKCTYASPLYDAFTSTKDEQSKPIGKTSLNVLQPTRWFAICIKTWTSSNSFVTYWTEWNTPHRKQACFCRCNNRRNHLTRVDWTSWNFILSCYWWTSTSGCSDQARQCSALAFEDLVNTYVSTELKAGYRYERIDIVFYRYQEETIKAAIKKQCIKSTRPIRRPIEGCDLPLPQNVRTINSC